MKSLKLSFLKSKVFLILAISGVTLVCVISFIVGYVLLQRNNEDSKETSMETTGESSDESNSDSEETEPEVDLEIEITDYPATIATSCDVLSFTVSVKNVGEKTLNYSDIKNDIYNFKIVTGDIISWDSSRAMEVSDFGSISVGETKEITFTGGQTYDAYGSISYHENNFRGIDDNITYQTRVDFAKPTGTNTYTVRGSSDPVNISTNIYEDPSENLLKSCGGV